MSIWDTTYLARYRAVCNNCYKGSLGVAIVFDLTDETSFKTIKGWIKTIKENTVEKVVLVILGNKSDRLKEREVNEKDIDALIKEVDLPYFETSAKTGGNVEEAFECMATEIKKRFIDSDSIFKDSFVLSVRTKADDNHQKGKGCCN